MSAPDYASIYRARIAQQRPDIEMIGDYLGSTVKTLFRHSCGEEWLTTPENILASKTCRRCSYIARGLDAAKSHSEYVLELAQKRPEISVLDEYRGKAVAILHQANECGHKYKMRPNSTLSGRGCPQCRLDHQILRCKAGNIGDDEYRKRVEAIHGEDITHLMPM